MAIIDTVNAKQTRMSGSASRKRGKVRIYPFPNIFNSGTKRNRLTILTKAIQNIQLCKYGQQSYIEIHRNTFNLVINKKGHELYNMILIKMKQHLTKNVRADILKCCKNNFLQSLVKAWDSHILCCNIFQTVFLYLDSNFIKPNQMDSIRDMGKILFRDLIMQHKTICEYLRDNILAMIWDERNGGVIDQSLIKTTIDITVELSQENQNLYKNLFENPFILQSIVFYTNEAFKFLHLNNCIEYIKQFEKRLDEEKIRVAKYLHASTECVIITIVQKVMFEQHINTILNLEMGVPYMLSNSLFKELKFFHDYCKKMMLLKEFVYLVVKCMTIEGYCIMNKINISKGIDIIEHLIDIYIRYQNVEKNVFGSNDLLKKLTLKYVEEVISKDANIPEYYALYFNNILNKNTINNDIGIVAKSLDRAMAIFRFLTNKDEFEYFYRRNLTKRLLYDKSVSKDNEEYVISKLKVECGNQFTHKLEGMIKEIIVANIHQEMFDQYVKRNELPLNGLELSVKVLSVGLWPIKTPGPYNFQADQNFAFETFKRFYLSLHEGRKLKLLPHLGNAFVTARFFNGAEDGSKTVSKKTYFLEVPSYHLAILVLFNSRDVITYNEIQQETAIEEPKLRDVLRSLIFCKPQRILIKTPENTKMEKSDEFHVNDKFCSKLRRIKIKNPILKSDKESDSKETRQKVDDDRKHEIEAAIVRIMKTRKISTYSNLIAEVISTVKNRFLPEPALIKKCIERLIDKEYIERLPDSNYAYIA